jgi:hypothetical protein
VHLAKILAKMNKYSVNYLPAETLVKLAEEKANRQSKLAKKKCDNKKVSVVPWH